MRQGDVANLIGMRAPNRKIGKVIKGRALPLAGRLNCPGIRIPAIFRWKSSISVLIIWYLARLRECRPWILEWLTLGLITSDTDAAGRLLAAELRIAAHSCCTTRRRADPLATE
jgi:hypothetical protein